MVAYDMPGYVYVCSANLNSLDLRRTRDVWNGPQKEIQALKSQRSKRTRSSLDFVEQGSKSPYANNQTSHSLFSCGFLSPTMGQKCVSAVLMMQWLVYHNCIVTKGSNHVSIHSFHRAEECVCLTSDLRAPGRPCC